MPALRLAVPYAALALAACASMPRYQQPNGKPAQLSLKVSADFDTVWQAVVETFAQSTMNIEAIEKASGLIAAGLPFAYETSKDLPEYVDFGAINGVWATSRVQAQPASSSARVRFNLLVIRGGEGQEVRVNTSWTGHVDANATNGAGGQFVYRVDLIGNTTGKFERRWLESIAKKLPPGSATVVETQAFQCSAFTPTALDWQTANPPTEGSGF